jgi:predicted nucleic acid-binding protein
VRDSPDPPADSTLAFLGPGERAAIPLALAVHADRLLSDDLAELSLCTLFGAKLCKLFGRRKLPMWTNWS